MGDLVCNWIIVFNFSGKAFDDEVLRFMNRRHTAEEAVRAIENLRCAGFNNISADIIFGIAGFGDSF